MCWKIITAHEWTCQKLINTFNCKWRQAAENTHTYTSLGIPTPLWCMYMLKAPLLLILIGPHRRRFQPAFDPKSSRFPPSSQMIRGGGLLLTAACVRCWVVGQEGGRSQSRFGKITSRSLLGWLSVPPKLLSPRWGSNTPSSSSEGLRLKCYFPLQSKTSLRSGLGQVCALMTARSSWTPRRGLFSPRHCPHTWTVSWRGRSRRPWRRGCKSKRCHNSSWSWWCRWWRWCWWPPHWCWRGARPCCWSQLHSTALP